MIVRSGINGDGGTVFDDVYIMLVNIFAGQSGNVLLEPVNRVCEQLAFAHKLYTAADGVGILVVETRAYIGNKVYLFRCDIAIVKSVSAKQGIENHIRQQIHAAVEQILASDGVFFINEAERKSECNTLSDSAGGSRNGSGIQILLDGCKSTHCRISVCTAVDYRGEQ